MRLGRWVLPWLAVLGFVFVSSNGGKARVVPDFDGGFIVVSYNVENLFDTINDPNTADDEFTPDGDRHWNSWRYKKKLFKIWQGIAATNLFNFPDVIGLCEVENRAVVQDLITKTPLYKGHYSILHKESGDRRGIDLALLYNASTFVPLDSAFIPVTMPKEPDFVTRDILYIKGLVKASKDTLHIFLNHWPSKYGGAAYTEPYRRMAARILRRSIDSVLSGNGKSKILCMGDFNDTPYDQSVNVDLRTVRYKKDADIEADSIYNIGYYMAEKKKYWSYWFQGRGELLDQVMVSGSLLGKSGLHLSPDQVFPSDEPMFFDKDGRVFRTYQGPVYKGGISDHLPIIINIEVE